MKWYAVKVVVNKEKKVKESIEFELRQNKLEKLLSNILISTHKKIQIRRGKKVNVETNSYPGYIFVETDSINELEGAIRRVNGVASILKEPLKNREIEKLLGKEEEVEVDDTLKIGQFVKVIDGPFSDFTGEIRELFPERLKAKINIRIFGRDTLLDLDYSQLLHE